MALHLSEPSTSAMTYPGNPSLAAEVRARILATFRQSVEAASRGERDQALLGCDFIQRLDPDFEPAQTLQQMIETNRSPESFTALLGQVPDDAAAPAPSPAATVPFQTPLASSAPGLVSTFTRLLEARRFADLLAAAQAQAAAVGGDAKLRSLVELAQSRYEAEPFVQELLDNARRALGSGQLEAIDGLLQKARSLDPTHPGLAEIDRLRSSASSTASTSLRIDWDDEEPAPTQVAPPGSAAEPPFDFEPPRGQPQQIAHSTAFESAAPAMEPVPDLDLPEIDFTVGDLPEPGGFDLAGEPAGVEDAPRGAAEDSMAEPEAGERVQALLDEGEAAFDRGEYQAAIDAWSRIFLIDIDNQDAAQRIEKARQLKAEQERETEEIFHAGVARFDAGDWEGAREAFRKVLDEQPSYILAREYLEKIDEREAAGESGPGLDLPEMAPLPADEGSAAPASAAAARPSAEEIMIPPDPGVHREARRPAVDGFAVKAKRRILPSPRFMAIGGAVLALLIVGGWYVSSRWETLFPNSRPPAPQAPAFDPVAQAKKLQADGKTSVAIATLRRVPPQDGAYAEAQSLIAQWEKLSSPSEPKTEAAPSPDQLERAQLLEQAKQAGAENDNYRAHFLLDSAAAIGALDGEWAELQKSLDGKLADYSQEMNLMRDGEYEMALNRLWRRHEADPSNLDTRRMMVDAYYNLSLEDLRRGDPRAARTKLRDALELDVSDPLLMRVEHFCAAYERRNQDLLYRIFVKYLPQR